jgi:Protein of unknown function (DUF1264)
MIPKAVYETLDADEQKLWHSHEVRKQESKKARKHELHTTHPARHLKNHPIF